MSVTDFEAACMEVERTEKAAVVARHNLKLAEDAFVMACAARENLRPPPPPADRSARAVSGAALAPGVPDQRPETDKPDGQHAGYAVLPEAERARGFVRPVRWSYRHVGLRPQHPTRPLTAEELTYQRANGTEYVVFEAYPPEAKRGACTGRYWTEAQLKGGCGQTTTMGLAIAETYARDPSYYGSTFCTTCGKHLPVGAHGEFVWAGTNERVGT